MSKFIDAYNRIILENKNKVVGKISITYKGEAKKTHKLIDTGMQTKYAFKGTSGKNREVQTYDFDGADVDVFDDGKMKTLSYGNQFGFQRPNKMSDIDILAELLKQNNYADTIITVSK
jgi:hypothetical protein